jgi:hypothetical protein
MRRAVLLIALAWAGCSGGSPAPQGPDEAAALVVAAGMTAVDPAPVDTVSAGADLDRLGLPEVDQVYEVTTPADEPFAFELISRGAANAGTVCISVAHAADDGAVPTGGVETLANVGVDLSASSTVRRDVWIEATGDGFARITVSGSVVREQVIAVETRTDAGRTTALIAIRIGPPSDINLPETPHGNYPGVIDEQTIYSSDSWRFGLPTIAVSGDRTSIVVYEGDQADVFAHQRYEMRLQHDGATGDVTGGASEEVSPDTGHWRDHEAAALYNVLALVHSGVEEVTLKLSFDRGATFSQVGTFGAGGREWVRLAQVAMAADYTLAVVYWTTGSTGASELVLVEGRPSAFDGTGSPSAFAFDPPYVVFRGVGDVTPAISGIAWSEGGDLVIGYGFTSFEVTDARETKTTSEFRCAVRLFDEGFTDHLVERDVVVTRDPSVSLVGEGQDLRIFYAYEGADGVRLRTSSDAGATWSAPQTVGAGWSYLPTVLARDQDGKLRVDFLYLTFRMYGTELHLRHWDDFDTGIHGDFRLTEAKHTPTSTTQQVAPDIVPPPDPFQVTEVSWFGYDATLDGDDVVVVYDEQTTDVFQIMLGIAPVGAPAGGEATFPGSAGDFVPADPPPLAPGLTEPVPPPDPDHMHQLRIARLD